jgi:hypothetical protein
VERFAFVMCAGFGLSAACCFLMYVRIRAGRFYPNRWLGVATSVTRRNGHVWERAHKAAAPWILRAGVVALLASVLAGASLIAGAEDGLGWWLTIAGAATGAAAVLIFKIGAEGSALAAAGSGRD